MNKLTPLVLATAFFATPALADETSAPRELTLYNETVFYDGYNETVFDADKNDGILRHRNNLYAVRLSDEQLAWFGENLDLNVMIGALCDNYDRIGNVNIAFVKKGDLTYDWKETPRIEIARFITPFMNKNRQPDTVPYDYRIDNVSWIMRDSKIRDKYDLWLEFELFGIPYAANQQISGCKDRNDVFAGTLTFRSASQAAPAVDNHILVPIVMKKPEYMGHNLNNYSEQGTDTIGKCIKTWKFEVPEDVADSRITFIISNHGANTDGEEYVRRLHLISVDGKQVMEYTPGGVSCEPYRRYNTQGNGIYSTYRSESFWKLYSNWCPGASIPVREIDLGPLKAGTHTFTVNVPKAVFADKQGDFPVSAYFQGVTDGKLPAAVYTPELLEPSATVTVSGGMVRWQCESRVEEAVIYSISGQQLDSVPGCFGETSVSGLTPGVYLLNLLCADGSSVVRKFIIGND